MELVKSQNNEHSNCIQQNRNLHKPIRHVNATKLYLQFGHVAGYAILCLEVRFDFLLLLGDFFRS